MTADGADPIAAARRLTRPELPERFYTNVGILEHDGLFVVTLDGRELRTPAKRPLALPTRALADALTAEWASQRETIDPATMPLTRIVNTARDGVQQTKDAVAADIVKYAGSDLLCYRAAGPARLVARQAAAWDPVLAWAREELRARFVLAEGVMFVEQPPDALERIGRAVAELDALRLAALHVMTTLTGSALLALAVERGRLTVEQAWTAAHVDEDWNIELWGADEEASTRRERRFREMQAAGLVLELLSAEGRAS